MEDNSNGYPVSYTPPTPYAPPTPPTPPSIDPTPIGKGYAVASMVLGIVGIAFSWTVFLSFLFAIGSIIGLVLSVTSKKRCAEAGLPPYGMGTAGLVLNIISLVFNGIGILGCAICVPAAIFMGM